LLTHAHIDHSGRIPKLCLDGFAGPIYATKATTELCAIMLPDSGHIQEMEAEWANRKNQRAGHTQVLPMYTMMDAQNCMKYFKKVSYGELLDLAPGVRARFNDAGHILGSSIIELWIKEDDGKETKIVFSGDLGNKNMPIMRDPQIIISADYLVIESTYGNRLHNHNDKVERFVNIICDTINRGGNVIIPSFAVGRTQEVIYALHKEREKYGGSMEKCLNIPVFVDSPLAVSATKVFRDNLDCYDEEARQYIENGDNPLDFPGLQFTTSVDDSKALNAREGSSVIISASGMCDAGRIKHHLKHNLWRSESTILFVGYQAQGTLGRRLVDGAKTVRIFGEEITVNARIEMLEGFSGHADHKGLMDWIAAFQNKPRQIFIVHGEGEAMTEFSSSIIDEFGIKTIIPSKGEAFLSTDNVMVLDDTKISREIKSGLPGVRKLAMVDLLDNLSADFYALSGKLKRRLKDEMSEWDLDELTTRLQKLQTTVTAVSGSVSSGSVV
ncbi:MAG: MBL fold metallo-hydrolase, partial [Clostridiales bacterium]|nr:MBL fold metallo-hydrolase [Clostridiales bacterium]